MATADAIMNEIRGCLREAAGRDHKTIECAIETAARRLDLPFSRAWSIWYGKVSRVWADEADTIRAKMQDIRQANILRLRAELARLEATDARITRELDAASQSSVDTRQGRDHSAAAQAAGGEVGRRRAGGRA